MQQPPLVGSEYYLLRVNCEELICASGLKLQRGAGCAAPVPM